MGSTCCYWVLPGYSLPPKVPIWKSRWWNPNLLSCPRIGFLTDAFVQIIVKLYSVCHFMLIECFMSIQLFKVHLSVCALSRSGVSNSLWPMDNSPPGSSVHGILRARILEWVIECLLCDYISKTNIQKPLPSQSLQSVSGRIKANGYVYFIVY